MRDLDRLALAMPETTKAVDDDGRVSYAVAGKTFVFHRSPRPDARDEKTGERLEDVLVFSVGDLDEKELILSDPDGPYFTTPHWNGYPAVLIRIPRLRGLRKAELRDVVEGAWVARAPKRLAKAWLGDEGDA